MSQKRTRSFVERALSGVNGTTRDHVREIVAHRLPFVEFAQRRTGSISEDAALYLRAITLMLRPKTAIEIGTYIGTSTFNIVADRIYTCDRHNDCFDSTKTVRTHPFIPSTHMLAQLAAEGVKAEFFFFDGRIRGRDLDLITRMSLPATVYAFDDYYGEEKGVVNVSRLQPTLPKSYVLVPPPSDLDTTIACLVPKEVA